MRFTPFLLLGVALACPACSLFRGACAEALPVIVQAQSLGADASLRIDQAEALLPTLPLTDEQRAQLKAAIAKARDAIAAGQAVLNDAAGACSAPDPVAVFADLLQAWSVIEPLLTPKLTAMGMPQLAVVVTPPQVVLMARRRLVAQ